MRAKKVGGSVGPTVEARAWFVLTGCGNKQWVFTPVAVNPDLYSRRREPFLGSKAYTSPGCLRPKILSFSSLNVTSSSWPRSIGPDTVSARYRDGAVRANSIFSSLSADVTGLWLRRYGGVKWARGTNQWMHRFADINSFLTFIFGSKWPKGPKMKLFWSRKLILIQCIYLFLIFM